MSTEPHERRLLVMAAPPKLPNEMTEDEIGEWADTIFDAMASAYRRS